MSFFAELKRRNVFKVAVAYIITSWLVAQVAQLAADSFGAPDWVMKMFITLLILGLPFAVIFAWAFEMTPEGLKKEKDVDRSRSIASTTGAKLNHTITIILVLALGYFVFDKFVLDPKRDAELVQTTQVAIEQNASDAEDVSEAGKPGKESIAVLPFVNMSDDGANEYFSDGLSEELLNLLAKIPDLKVAARTSSFQFKGKTGDIETIASQLKVANVLEGSVRKSGNQVRITAQLIQADNGYHLWSETYDRTLENIFVVQDEIAAAVVDALKVTLLGAPAPIAKEANAEAYALYLQGRYWYNLSGEDNAAKSMQVYQQAIDIDPGYAPAWAGLSISTIFMAGQGWIDLKSGVTKAREAAEKSVTLDPGLALGWVSLSEIQYYYDWNWEAAIQSMQMALKLEPNASYVLRSAGRISKDQGQLERAVSFYRQAIAVDPLNQRLLDSFSGALEAAGLLQEAEQIGRHLLSLNPDYFAIQSTLGWILLRQGNAEQALLETQKDDDGFWKDLITQLCLYSLGRHAEADAALAALIEKYRSYGAYQIAESYGWRNEPDEAFKWLDIAYEQHDPGMGALPADATLRNLHRDPRWEALLKKMSLLDAWHQVPAKYKGPLQ